MKELIKLFIVSLLFISCANNSEFELLNSKIKNLEKDNKILKDSILNMTVSPRNRLLLGIPLDSVFSKNKQGEITFYLVNNEKIPSYNVYEVDENNLKGKLLYSNITHSSFNHKFTPTKTGEKRLRLIAEFKYGESGEFTFQIPAEMSLNIK